MNDVGGCCLASFCPCFAFMEIAENIGDNGTLYCIAPFCGLGCCVLAALGDNVAKKRQIQSDMCTSCCKAFCDGFICYSCTVLNESRVYKAQFQGNAAAVQGQAMERK